MFKPATVVIGAASLIALAAIFGVFALRDNRSVSAPPEEPEPGAEPASAEATPADAKPRPRLLRSVVAPPTLRAAAVPDAGKLLDEQSLLARLHELAGSDPLLSLKLAKEAVDRFPDSPNAPEFQWNVVKALSNMDRGDEAMNEARIMVWRYPGTYFAGDVERHLLHPQPNPSDAP
jgi:hypothetical protein